MKVAVTTPSGHVGGAVADYLLGFDGGLEVVLLGRRPDRLGNLIDRGATLAIGSQDDVDYLCRSTEGVDALYWATPPGYGSDNVRAFQHRLGEAVEKTIRANKIPRVVNMSSVGAILETGAGPVSGLHDVEQLINKAACHVTHLRPGFFFENMLFVHLDPLNFETGFFQLFNAELGFV